MKINNYLSFEEIEKLYNIKSDSKVKCKCGHSIFLTNKYERIICDWCGRWVYKNKKVEFKYKLLEAKNKNKEGEK